MRERNREKKETERYSSGAKRYTRDVPNHNVRNSSSVFLQPRGRKRSRDNCSFVRGYLNEIPRRASLASFSPVYSTQFYCSAYSVLSLPPRRPTDFARISGDSSAESDVISKRDRVDLRFTIAPAHSVESAVTPSRNHRRGATGITRRRCRR